MNPLIGGGAGAAAVLGVLLTVRQLRPRVRPAAGPPGSAASPWVPASVRGCLEATDNELAAAVAARGYLGLIAVAPLVFWTGAGPLLALAATVAVALAPRLALPWLRQRRTVRRDDQLAPYLERVASNIRSGQSMRIAVVETARAAERPLTADLRPLADALDHGAAMDDALANWASAPGASAEVRLAAAALQLGARAGGEVARAVDAVAATLRERREVRGEAIALATQARLSAGLLVVAPLAFAGLISTIEPGAVRFLLGTPIGLACLAGGVGLDTVGGLWMQRIVRRPM